MPNTATEQALLKKRDVAAFLQCSQRQVEILASRGDLPRPVYIAARSPRWRRDDLVDHVAKLAEAGA